MSDLLENELVKKYFGCQESGLCEKDWHEQGASDYSTHHIAYRVLRAMQEPIRKGERILQFYNCPIREEIAVTDNAGFHPFLLRLPDRFQGEKKPSLASVRHLDWICNACQTHVDQPCQCKCHEPAKPLGVEEQLKQLEWMIAAYGATKECSGSIKHCLRALVDLVRKEGK